MDATGAGTVPLQDLALKQGRFFDGLGELAMN